MDGVETGSAVAVLSSAVAVAAVAGSGSAGFDSAAPPHSDERKAKRLCG